MSGYEIVTSIIVNLLTARGSPPLMNKGSAFMPTAILDVIALDILFPTSRNLDRDADYSAAYVILEIDHPDGLEGHGLTFTIERGNEVCVAAINALAPHVRGKKLESFTENMGDFWRSLTGDTQLRWIGPEKGAIRVREAWTS